ncbi:Aste57867_25450 [Aphanomyces stellatus]|uniref:Aste57867_25450 protein n=1 Tax=Aphanomyces stellatus TaxID=120398 RepID=A0A485LT71_9STRA|nr:hypothetical protein As57867_025371 [Aphanomyces stellatus]VFU02073.1 Aste57867_25450 [Aphanomyces stellatus]
MTAKYMTILHAYVQNDYFWTNFNASGAQTFVSDVFNSQLWNTTSGARDLSLFSIDVATEKDYSQPQTIFTIQATDARRIIMEQLNILPVAIMGLRNQTIIQSAESLTCYCWLDFRREWEVAHTAARQARCRTRYANNGAVYMESMLRNVDWTAWYAKWGLKFEIAYGNALEESAGGMAWINQTSTARYGVTVDSEVEYWTACNISQYIIPWHNANIGGFDNYVVVQTALRSYSIAVNHIQSAWIGHWTSVTASIGVWNDLGYAVDVNASLVRNATNSFTKLESSLNPEMWTGGYPSTPWSILFHDEIGPFASVDLIYVLPPTSIIQLYQSTCLAFLQDLQTNSQLNQVYQDTANTATFDMVPPTWIGPNVMYFGGNPLCYSGDAQAYVQQSFGFDDACTEPYSPLTVVSQTKTIVLALLLQSSANFNLSHTETRLTAICALNQIMKQPCHLSIQRAALLLDLWQATFATSTLAPSISRATHDVLDLNISLMQYANLNSTPVVLLQPILDVRDPNWSFYGWLLLLDWLQGMREVVSFEGDANTLVLISKQYATESYDADPLEIPNRLSNVVWLLILYMCIVSAFVTTLAFICGLVFPDGVCDQNLFFLNPVVGIVWIGRPLLMLRGLTAMCLLSSGNVHLLRENSFTHFISTRKTFLDSIIVSGETLWLTYAINDILSVITQRFSFYCAILSSTLVWIVSLVLELVASFEPMANFDRTCLSSNMDMRISCMSGVIQVGSSHRLALLCVVQCICIGLSYGVARIITKSPNVLSKAPVVIPAVSSSYLTRVNGSSKMYFDARSSVLCGLITFHTVRSKYTFSVVLWVLVSVNDKIDVFRKPTLRLESSMLTSVAPTYNHIRGELNRISVENSTKKLRAIGSMLYLLCSAISSALFFYVVQDQLSNDFLWSGFNSTGMLPFVLDGYNKNMMYHSQSAQYDMSGTSLMAFYNKSSATVSSSRLYSSVMQFEQISLIAVINGLRASDACQLPWMSTQYCWVDFNLKWEMANSIQRQRRCQDMTTNGALYVESILRNSHLERLYSCWGDVIEIGIFNELRQSSTGRGWLANITTKLSPADEVGYWIFKNITQFVTQWQNYKLIGVIETVAFQNALGMTYPVTMKSSTGTFQFSLQTSMKMYWGWGSDMWVISQNDTLWGHRSLIRSSANFAFVNATLETAMIQNSSLPTPLEAGLVLVRNFFGPFGSVDLIHIPWPSSLMLLYNEFTDAYTKALHANASAQAPVQGAAQSLQQIPTKWMQLYSTIRGGNILCPTTPALPSLYGMLALFRLDLTCGSMVAEVITLSIPKSVLALSAWEATRVCPNSPCPSVPLACKQATGTPSACKKGFSAAQGWVSLYLSQETLENLQPLARQVHADVALLNISVVQYVQVNESAPVELLHYPVFTSGDASFDLMSWVMLIEWITWTREAVSIQGDVSELNVLSSVMDSTFNTPNALEIPNNVSYYSQLCIQYTTAMGFLVTFIALVYVIASRFHVEGLNMLEVNRVGGIVWIGRPLLVLRSAIAILFLATGSVQLQIDGYFSVIVTPKASGVRSLSTVLAGSETCWLVIVLTDLFMVVTKNHTNKYSLKSSIIVTLASIIMSWARPVTPQFIVSRTCDSSQVDFQLICHAGVVQIGSYERTLQLVVMTSTTVCLCFAWEYWRDPSLKLPSHRVSLFLPAGAHYLYHKRPWIFNNTLYLDKASAFLCGLVSVKYRRVVYVLDIKTWRTHTILIDSDFDSRLLSAHVYDQTRINYALPMVE